MSKRYGVIDLGTNTFHVLIAEKGGNASIEELHRERIFVKLGEDGIQKIGAAPFERGLQALRQFKNLLSEYQVHTVKAFGTAALRTASNGKQFIKQANEEIGIKIKLIAGDEEARLIHLGVTQAVHLGTEKGLIMDIGGGSVEFIIANADGVIWAKSFPIGVSVLFNQFHHSDPITNNDISVLEAYLEQELKDLFKILENHKTPVLIGASGTFDVLESLLSKKRFSNIHARVKAEDFFPLYNHFLNTNLSERLQMEKLPNSRAELIIVALILINLILTKAKIQRISVSAYAMKEGMLQDMS